MNTLIISDTPFMNYKHSNFSYDLSLVLASQEKKHNVYYYVNNLNVKNDDKNKHYTIDLNCMVSTFHGNMMNNIIPNGVLLKYVHQQEINAFDDVKFILRNNKYELDQNMLDEIMNTYKIDNLYLNMCFGMNIDESINFDYPNTRKILYYDVPCVPLCNNYETLTNKFDELITFNEKYYHQLKHHYPKKIVHKLKYQFNICEKMDVKIIPETESELINLKYLNKIKYNIPLNKKIFFTEIDSHNFKMQETKLLDLYFRLIERINEEYPDKYFFILNTPSDFIFQHIQQIFKNRVNPRDVLFLNDYYDMNSLFWKYKYVDLVMISDAIVCLSGFEMDHNASYIANLFNIPVFFNNTENYLTNEIENGTPHDDNISLFIANSLQSFIKYPPFKHVYENFIKFVSTKVVNNKYRYNSKYKSNYLDYYTDINNIINY